MLKKSVVLAVLVVVILSMVACSTHIHQVGRGPQTGQQIQARQWYILWGLVPISDVDTNQMAGGAADYQIKTETSFLDFVIGYFTGIVTINCRTVTVTK